MKLLKTILFLALCTAAFTGCGADDEPTQAPTVLSMTIVDKSGALHMASLDAARQTALINSLTSREDIAAVKYTLTPDTQIAPDPALLKDNCKRDNLFTLTHNGEQISFHLQIPNLDVMNPDLLPDPKEWTLDWSEEFNGTSFDESVWEKVPRATPDWSNTMAPYDDLFGVSNGILSLWGRRNTSHPEDPSSSLTGGLWSRNLKAFRGGRIDIRARFMCARGFWPALWLRPQDGPTDEYAEIDILEHINMEKIAHQTVHSNYTINVDKEQLSNTMRTPLEDLAGWHIYSVELHEDKVRFLIDNRETFSYPRLVPEVEGQFPFYDRSFFIILSAQLGGKWPGEVNLDQLPVKLDVDFVRHYIPAK